MGRRARKYADVVVYIILDNSSEAEAEYSIGVAYLLPGVLGIRHVEGMSQSQAAVKLYPKESGEVGEAVQVQDSIGKDIHAVECVRIEAVGRCVLGVAGGGVFGISGAESQAEDVVDVVSPHKTGLAGEEAHGLPVFPVGEIVLVNIEHGSRLKTRIKATFMDVLHRLGGSRGTQ